jgi:hypothetical protein
MKEGAGLASSCVALRDHAKQQLLSIPPGIDAEKEMSGCLSREAERD